MFGIGSTELVVIAVVALMLFSPRELPKIIRSVAKFWGSLRATADEFRDAIMSEEELQEIKGAYRGTQVQLRQAEAAARREMMKARMEMRRAQQKLAAATRASTHAQDQATQTSEGAADARGEAIAHGVGTPLASPAASERPPIDDDVSSPPPASTTATTPPRRPTGGKGMSQGAA